MTMSDYKKLYSQKIRLILVNNVILTLNLFPMNKNQYQIQKKNQSDFKTAAIESINTYFFNINNLVDLYIKILYILKYNMEIEDI